MLQIILSAFISLIAFSCSGPRYVDYFPYHDDGTPKPKVALMSMIDSSDCELPWDTSEEISEGLYYELMNSGDLYLLSPQEIGPSWNKQKNMDFFGNNMTFSCEFSNADFIVALELIEHSVTQGDQITSTKSNSECHGANRILTLRTRVKIIDVRFEKPRVILYEIVKDSFALTAACDNINYSKNGWGTEGYLVTPCGRVHQRAIHHIAERLEQAIVCAK